jgi:Protein of unknown function (DUF998)
MVAASSLPLTARGPRTEIRERQPPNPFPPSPVPRNLTRSLLAVGALAGPLYVGVGALEVLLREGFDIRRHALSLMSNGVLGWIQITSFLLSGAFVIIGAIGVRQAWKGSAAGAAGPLLLGLYGLGLIGAGLFVADPMDGFPPGTPPGPPAALSWHGPLHFLAGGIGFFALIAACLVIARRFLSNRQPAWAYSSGLTGLLFLGGFAGIASGSRSPGINLGFTATVVLVWIWLTALYLKVRTTVPEGTR